MIEPFTGPLTAVEVFGWLSRCEDDFQEYDSSHPNPLTNKDKINRTGRSISSAQGHDSKPLSTWYTRNRDTLEKKDWDSFQNLVKEHALGNGWRIKVLKDFYTYNQGPAIKLDNYLEKFEELKYAVERSQLEEINDMAYKCHIIFGSTPGLVEKFIQKYTDDQKFIGYDVEKIKAKLKKLDGAGSQVPQAQALDTPQGTYITSGLFGTSVSTSGTDAVFSCLVDMPTSSTAVGHLTRIDCYYNNLSTKPQIQLLTTYFGSAYKYYPSPYRDLVATINCFFAAGEYLIQVVMTRDNGISAISSITLKTSLNKEYFIGNAAGERMTFTAPEKWRIVGFHGTAGSYVDDSSVPNGKRYPITRLGVVYAPIL